jgi:hypothetical protein
MNLDKLEAVAREATKGEWRWAWREDDELAPGSVYAVPREGHAYAVVMCPRYGTESFAKDAAHIAAFNPQVAIKLIAAVRAANQLVSETAMLFAMEGVGREKEYFAALDSTLRELEQP